MSPAIRLLTLVDKNQGHQRSYSNDRWRAAIHAATQLAIAHGLKFAPDDFAYIAHHFAITGWGKGEGLYHLACRPPKTCYYVGAKSPSNRSAAISFERWKGREPFILFGRQRLAVGAKFVWYGGWVECTSFSKDGKHLIACSYFIGKDGQPNYPKVAHRRTITHADIRKHRAAIRKASNKRMKDEG